MHCVLHSIALRGNLLIETKFGNAESCPSIKNILLLDSEGNRVAVKYYSDEWPNNSAKEAFEKSLFTKTQKTNARTEAEIAMFESHIIVYKFVQDLHFFVTGAENENELVLVTVLQGFFDAVGLLLRGTVDKKEALENLDLILLCLDEIVDGGIILETDANVIAGKVASHNIDAAAPLSEQTISQALATAREHLARSLLKDFGGVAVKKNNFRGDVESDVNLVMIIGTYNRLLSDAGTIRVVEENSEKSTSLSREIDEYMDVRLFMQTVRGDLSDTFAREGSASSKKKRKIIAGATNIILSNEDEVPATIPSVLNSLVDLQPPPRALTEDIFGVIVDYGPLGDGTTGWG
ncbi:hypothetical protein GOBAR_AA38718 [Gossypium barbadense]|uniref:Coatomer subunit zeta n=1 Tax=Gossypium barbadense TaxID=3634 RepID=A0A2P5VT40_GOSBA|nr:hypothetical protein GOBAR_AA38718 [Gossypium barbadense]